MLWMSVSEPNQSFKNRTRATSSHAISIREEQIWNRLSSRKQTQTRKRSHRQRREKARERSESRKKAGSSTSSLRQQTAASVVEYVEEPAVPCESHVEI